MPSAASAGIQEILEDAGLGALNATVEPARRREHSTVYTAWLRHTRGDARIEIYVYDLTEDPVGVVDAEEERIALAELESELVPELLLSHMDDDVALLVVADTENAQRLRRYLGSQDEADHQLTYQPDLDRLLGGEELREIEGGRITLSSLMSRRRAEALYSVLHHLAETIGATADSPSVPVVTAVFEIEHVDGLIESLGHVPAEYANLAVLTTVISRLEPLGDPPMRLESADAGRLAVRLFTTLRETHRLPATLSRAGGCSISGPFITPTGELVDAYFLTAGDELDPADLAQLQIRDVLHAVHLLTETIDPDDPLLTKVISAGIDAYTGMPVRPPVAELVDAVANSRDLPSMQSLAAAVHRLASQSSWRRSD